MRDIQYTMTWEYMHMEELTAHYLTQVNKSCALKSDATADTYGST